MKRCPECRRDYYDDSLSFCLDDGAHLLEGPASEEPATAILAESGAAATGSRHGEIPLEQPTRTFAPQSGASDASNPVKPVGRRNSFISGILSVVLVTVLGIGGYLYYDRGPTKQIESIAVMPFVNESGNADVEYLSDGMTESLINSLMQLPNLNVKARSSVFRYKGKETDAATIGRELNVQAILNGRIVQRGDGLTLYLELVDAQTGNRIWGDQYNRKQTDLISLKTEIARDVAIKLQTKLTGADEKRLTKSYTANSEAYQLYLRGRFHTLKIIRPELLKAVSYLEKAIEIDPNYAMAYVGLADAYRGLTLGGEMRPEDYFPKAKAAAQKALEIDNDLAEAHAMLGWLIYWYDWDWKEAEKHCKRALELDPNTSDTHMAYAHILSSVGRHEEALAAAKRSVELEPLNLRNIALETQFLIHAGRADEAISKLERALELDANYWFAYQYKASAFIDKGMYAEAAAAARRGYELHKDNTRMLSFLGFALARSGKTKEARETLDNLLKLSNERFVPPYNIAMVYNGLGERDEAIAWLERGVQQRDPRLTFLKSDPKWNNLRDDPRYHGLLRKVGFPE
ncbi:MAG: tetratricopeptide repeat protein [Pyrinomonadaceae bacterium]